VAAVSKSPVCRFPELQNAGFHIAGLAVSTSLSIHLLRGACSQIVFGGNHHQNAEGQLAAKLSEETILHI